MTDDTATTLRPSREYLKTCERAADAAQAIYESSYKGFMMLLVNNPDLLLAAENFVRLYMECNK